MNSGLPSGVAADPHKTTFAEASGKGEGDARSTAGRATRAARRPCATSAKYSRFQWFVKNVEYRFSSYNDGSPSAGSDGGNITASEWRSSLLSADSVIFPAVTTRPASITSTVRVTSQLGSFGPACSGSCAITSAASADLSIERIGIVWAALPEPERSARP
jgi:hypothetical protein